MKLLQHRLCIPKICDTRIVQITHTIWTQLEKGNERIYFNPLSDSIIVLCPEKDPIDVILTGTGKLTIQPSCKGYSLTDLLQNKNNIQVNTSKYGGDLLSRIESPFDCCEGFGLSRNLSHNELDLKFKHIVTYVEKHNRSGMVAVLGPFEALPYYIYIYTYACRRPEIRNLEGFGIRKEN
jgi:hypothetical protein